MNNTIQSFESALTKDECELIIKKCMDADVLHLPGKVSNGIDTKTKASTDLPLNGFSNPILKPVLKAISENIQTYIESNPGLNDLPRWQLCPEYNFQWYKPGEGFFSWHSEWGLDNDSILRMGAWMVNLNTIEEGGETIFQHCDNIIKPVQGQLSFFSADWTHSHKGVVAPNEDKYILTGWFKLEVDN